MQVICVSLNSLEQSYDLTVNWRTMLMCFFFFFNYYMFMFFYNLLDLGQNNRNVINFPNGCHFQSSGDFLCEGIVGVLAVKGAILNIKLRVSVDLDIRVFAVISES